MRVKIADIEMGILHNYNSIDRLYKDFMFETESNKIIITVDQSEIDDEKSISTEVFLRAEIEDFVILRKIAEKLYEYDSFLLHSAVIDIDGCGVAFAAPSGTGKTTHLLNWQKYLGSKMKIVNGDKPIIRFFDEKKEIPFAYGTPWCGKEELGCNMRTKLKHICFIERSDKNFVEKIGEKDAFDRLIKQVHIPKNSNGISKTFSLIDRAIRNCNLWIIHCNMKEESAIIAYNSIIAD